MTKKKLKMIIGENVRKERNALGLTITELAAMLEVTAPYLGLIENGKRGTSSFMCYKLAEAFKITVDGLFVYDDNDSDRTRFIREDHNRDGLKMKRDEICALVSDVDEDTYKFILTYVKNYRAFRKKKASAILEDPTSQ